MQVTLFFYHQLQQELSLLTPPSGAGKAVTRVGEASTATDLAIHIEPPVLLSIMAGVKDLEPYAANLKVLTAVLDFNNAAPADCF